MQSISTTIRRVGTFGVAVTLGLFLLGGTASAAPKGERGKGPEQTTTVTEDNDKNDGDTPNNVIDDGDNAHPSGKDRSVERGGSGNQGKAKSDPDDDGRGPDRSNGGVDQPGGAGGVDLADQDGNNGCGNDDDFEDDNEGWCGKPKATKPTVDQVPAPFVPEAAPTPAVTVTAAAIEAPPVTTAPAVEAVALAEVAPAATTGEIPTQVLGVTHERAQAERPTEVLGVSFERGSLARTGISITTLILLAVALVAIGVGCKRAAQRA